MRFAEVKDSVVTMVYDSTPLAWSKVESISLISAAGATVRLLVEEVL